MPRTTWNLAGVSGTSVRKAEEWLAGRFPRPAVAPSIRKLPERLDVGAPEPSPVLELPATSRVQIRTLGDAPGEPHSQPSVTPQAPAQSGGSNEAPSAVSALTTLSTSPADAEPARSSAALAPQRPTPARGSVEPLSSERFVVKFTATREEKELLELARDLLSHANPSGDIGVVVVRGLRELVAKLQRKKLGQARRPRKAKQARSNGSSHVTQSVRREVIDRDGFECSFVSEDGHRCGATAFLEFEHRQPRGKGGDSEAQNLRLHCRAHNRFVAEQAYGKAQIARAIAEARSNTSPHESDKPLIVREQRSHLYLRASVQPLRDAATALSDYIPPCVRRANCLRQASGATS